MSLSLPTAGSAQAKCFSCRAALDFSQAANVPRGEVCSQCRADVRVCLNCSHYDAAAYNQCRESMADRVLDKDRSNFCDYFRLRGSDNQAKTSEKEAALKKLDELFAKKS